MIKREDYLSETKGLKAVNVLNEQFYRTEDYYIGGKLIRYSWIKNVCRETLAMLDSAHVHKYDMGAYSE